MADRLGVLHARMQELSPRWRIDMATSADGQTFRFSERFPGAAKLDPIRFCPTYSFPEDDPEALETKQQLVLLYALDFGGDVVVPGRYVERLDIDASDEVRRLLAVDSINELQIGGEENNEGLPLLCRLEVAAPDGTALAGVDFQPKTRRIGRRGVTLLGSDASGFLQLTNRVEFDNGRPSVGTFNFAIEDQRATGPTRCDRQRSSCWRWCRVAA